MRAPRVRATRPVASLLLPLFIFASPLSGQSSAAPRISVAARADSAVDPITAPGYIAPPAAIARLVDAPRDSNYAYSSANPGNRRYLLRMVGDGLPTLAALGKPHYNLAGFQVDWRGNRARSLTTRSSAGIELREWATDRIIRIAVPTGARVGSTAWSPDGSSLAFMAELPDATHLFVADPATGKVRQVTTTPLLATMVTNFEWTADGRSLIAVLLPTPRRAEPAAAPVATEPRIRINDDNRLKTRTYASLLETDHDKALLEYYTTGQLALIDVKSRAVRKIGAPAMIRSLDASPDGRLFRITSLDKPFSWVLPWTSFGTTETLMDQTGKVLRQMANRPLRESDPDTTRTPTAGAGGRGAAASAPADTGRRSLGWDPFQTAMLYLQVVPAEKSRRGDSAASTTPRQRPDRLMRWVAPFDSTSAQEVYRTEGRLNSYRFSDDGTILFTSETANNQTTDYAVWLGDSVRKVALYQRRNGNGGGRGGAGGVPFPPAAGRGGTTGGSTASLVNATGRRGVPVVMTSPDGKSVFLQGTTTGRESAADSAKGAATEVDSNAVPKVWIERVDLQTGKRSRIYESTGEIGETILSPLDADFQHALIQRESKTVVGQTFVLTLADGSVRQLTHNRDLMPEITNAIRRVVWARRADGHTFRINVTLPRDYREGTRLPALFWFYPSEFQDQAAYDRGLGGRGGAAPRYPSYGPRSIEFLVTQGYAVIQPDAPIFSENGQPPNDHYVDDLRDDLAATIDALDTLAIIDRQRLGIGGHSYGAFSTANAMVHTPFFKAGIAGDGNYNRTLTPNGFQNERRDLWQGRDVYLAMSPFLYADRLNGALLMYHSEEDQNVGTDPINSIKMFHALMGLGKTTALYMYPYEDHGPVARETVLDQWARWVAWLDKYVKQANRPPAAKAATSPATSPGAGASPPPDRRP